MESLEAVCLLVVGYASYNEYQRSGPLKNDMESLGWWYDKNMTDVALGRKSHDGMAS